MKMLHFPRPDCSSGILSDKGFYCYCKAHGVAQNGSVRESMKSGNFEIEDMVQPYKNLPPEWIEKSREVK